MNFIFEIINYPFAWILAMGYHLTNSYAMALVIFAVITKLLLLPLAIKQQKSSLAQVRFQPKVKEIQEKYKTNRQKQQEELNNLYQKEGYKPLSGCLPMLIQLPIMLSLYNVIRGPITYLCGIPQNTVKAIIDSLGLVTKTVKGTQLDLAAKFLEMAKEHNVTRITADLLPGIPAEYLPANGIEVINFDLFGKINLTSTPSFAFNWLLLIPILACLTGFAMSYMSQRYSPMQSTNSSMNMMLFVSPVISLFFSFSMPAGIGLYWTISNVISVAQTYFIGKKYNPKKYAQQLKEEEEAVKEEKRRIRQQKFLENKNNNNNNNAKGGKK